MPSWWEAEECLVTPGRRGCSQGGVAIDTGFGGHRFRQLLPFERRFGTVIAAARLRLAACALLEAASMTLPPPSPAPAPDVPPLPPTPSLPQGIPPLIDDPRAPGVPAAPVQEPPRPLEPEIAVRGAATP